MAAPIDTKKAQELGLSYLSGSMAMAIFHRIKTLEQADCIGAAVLEQVADLDGSAAMPSFVPLSAAKGTYRNFETYLCTEIHSPSVLTVMCLFPKPEQRKLLLYPEGFLSKIGKRLFKTQDLQIGDDRLDSLVMVKSSDPKSTLASLQRPLVIEALLALYERHPDTVINDIGLRLKLTSPGVYAVRDALEHLSDVIERLTAAC
jgi:hypothetical protein